MTKRTIKETIREYDAHGKLVRETITETQEEETTSPTKTTDFWWSTEPYCGYQNGDLTPNYCTKYTPSSVCDTSADTAISTALEGDPTRIGTVYASGACDEADAAITSVSYA